jgi:hypothetical protein
MYTIHSSKKLSKNGNEGRNKSACENDAIKTRGVEGWWYKHQNGNNKVCTLFSGVERTEGGMTRNHSEDSFNGEV